VGAEIEIWKLRKEFRMRDRVTEAIADISCEIGACRFVSVVGPSGCGKSTLLRIVAGLLSPSGGQVLVRGHVVTGPRHEMMYVFQQYNKSLYPWKTVLKNVAFGLENRGRIAKRELQERCARFIGLVGLQGFEAYYPWQLSGGMQQRVALARALACEPAVLLMDEPFSSVDAQTRANLQDLVLRLWQELEVTVMFVTHDIEEAVYLSTEVMVLSRAPARLVERLEIALPYPRHQLMTRESKEYLDYRHAIYGQVFDLPLRGSR